MFYVLQLFIPFESRRLIQIDSVYKKYDYIQSFLFNIQVAHTTLYLRTDG